MGIESAGFDGRSERFINMKRFFVILPLFGLLLLASCLQHPTEITVPASPEDAEYTRFLDSIDSIIEGFYYYDFNDSIILPALEFYKENDSKRNLWMQARSHYLIGVLQFGENHVSEKAAKHLVEAL